jgi:hypothetical protein
MGDKNGADQPGRLGGYLLEKGENKTAGAFMLRLVAKASIAKNGSAGQQ